MTSQLALHHYGCGHATVSECAIPEPANDEVVVKIAAVCLNPIDWKIFYGTKSSEPTILGCDFAGTVTCIGDGVTAIEIGDRVIGFVAGGNPLRPNDGAFAQYVAVPAHIILHLPKNMLFESGATLPTPLFVGGFCLYRHLSIPYPSLLSKAGTRSQTIGGGNKWKSILIYGGGTSNGSMQIQLAKLSGLQVYTVCSRASHELAQQCGADYIFYHDEPPTLELLRIATQGSIEMAIDCIATEQSAAICASNMETSGGKYISLTGVGRIHDPRILTVNIFGFTMLNREFLFESKGIRAEINVEDVNFAADFAPHVERLLALNVIKHNTVEVRSGGLNGIISGLEDMKAGRVRKKRLVYVIDSTEQF
ncbi:GroES-like protein [Trichoderma asperelloides]|nr:GroES-like protein [Trichoderma asperelloides]